MRCFIPLRCRVASAPAVPHQNPGNRRTVVFPRVGRFRDAALRCELTRKRLHELNGCHTEGNCQSQSWFTFKMILEIAKVIHVLDEDVGWLGDSLHNWLNELPAGRNSEESALPAAS